MRLVLLLVILVTVPTHVTSEEVTNFFNVVASRGADPWLWRHDGQYYSAASTGGNISLTRSRFLSTLGAGERKVVWNPPVGTPVARDLWAPELHRLGKAWYLYVAADDGENANHRMYVLENKSEDPWQGAFVFKAQVVDPKNDRWAIDGTVFRVGEALYFVWSGWEGAENVRQNLYIAPMSNPWTLSGARVEISRPSRPWEMQGAPPAVNEGPQVLVRDRRVLVVYSASGSWTDSYCLGMLTADIESNLLSPASWTKHDRPVFASARGVYGPGHCTFVKSPDGREDWIVYHAARYQGAAWTRLIRAQPFAWDADGLPHFGLPAAPDRPIPIPGGEPARERYEAEAAELAGTARVVHRPGASRGAGVRLADREDDSLSFMVEARAAGDHVVSIRYLNASERRAPATQSLTVNDDPPRPVRYDDTGPADWSNAFVTVTLKAGSNRIRLAPIERVTEIDCVDIVRGEP